MNNDPSPHRPGRLVRALWVLGLALGIAIGVVAAIGLATTDRHMQTESAR